jgi:hypothetical protein
MSRAPGGYSAAYGPSLKRLLTAVYWLACWAQLTAWTAETRPPGVVLNEILFHPADGHDELQYLELFNAGSEVVDLSGWAIKAGVKFHFPEGSKIPPDGYLLTCRDAAAFKARYGAQWLVAGEFKGKFSHAGERVELIDAGGRTQDALEYADRSPWPLAADGYGASLERICPAASGSDPANWQASEYKSRQLEGTPGARNSCYSAKPLPRIDRVQVGNIQPGQPIVITASVAAPEGIQAVALSWAAFEGLASPVWSEVPMELHAGDARQGQYEAAIPAHPADRLLRFRLAAISTAGLARIYPAKSEPRPAFSISTFVNTNTASVPFVQLYTVKAVRALPQASQFRDRRSNGQLPPSKRAGWTSAAIYLPPGGKAAQVFDFVRVRARRGGVKVHFHKDQRLGDKSAVAIIDKGPNRWMLAEYLSQDLFRRVGAAAPETEFTRVWLNRRSLGLQLQVETINPSFLRRRGRDENGNLYKLEWAGNGLVGQHKQVSGPPMGHKDLVTLFNGLKRTSGQEQWELINQSFNVEQMVNCYVAGMCVQDWDGFFNNYFVYHDLRAGGKWEIYPWDKDKTWGDYDGASARYDWCAMPLTFGMNTAQSTAGDSFFGFGGFNSWMRPPGWFSGPLLANPEFRKRFLARLREVNQTIFTPEKMAPVIQGLANRLKPEMEFRAVRAGHNPDEVEAELQSDIRSFENQVARRRDYILKHLPAEKP